MVSATRRPQRWHFHCVVCSRSFWKVPRWALGKEGLLQTHTATQTKLAKGKPRLRGLIWETSDSQAGSSQPVWAYAVSFPPAGPLSLGMKLAQLCTQLLLAAQSPSWGRRQCCSEGIYS